MDKIEFNHYNGGQDHKLMIEAVKILEKDYNGDFSDNYRFSLILANLFRDLNQYNVDEVYGACYPIFLRRWSLSRQPFYRLYPGVLESLLKFNLNYIEEINNSDFEGVVMIELPKGWEIKYTEGLVTNILFEIFKVYGKEDKCIFLYPLLMRDNYVISGAGGRVNLLYETLFSDKSIYKNEYRILLKKCLSIITGCLFLENNPYLIDHVVMNKDRLRYEVADEETKKRYVEKAHNRGLIGLEIGKDIYYQGCEERDKKFQIVRAHLQLYHTKNGPIIKRKEPYLRNLENITNCPQGYYLKDKGDQE